MCAILDRVENRGMKRRIAQGMERGMQRGLAQGYERAALTMLQNLMQNTHMTAEQAMDALGIAESERQKYARLLSQ